MMAIVAEAAGDLSPSGFWGAVGLASAIATAFATAASSITAIWWRMQDRTEAEWSVRMVGRGGRDDNGSRVAAPRVAVVIQNIGDGVAHQVCVSGHMLAEQPLLQEAQRAGDWESKVYQPIPVLRTGDSVRVTATAESFEAWDRATIEVSWWPPPTRKKKDWWIRSRQKSKCFPLRDITHPPNDLPLQRERTPGSIF